MKKNLFYVCALICSMSLFTACSDDDDPMIPPADLNSSFGTDKNTELTLNYGDAPLTGKQVKFETTDSKTATMTLADVIPGEAETVISNIQLIAGDGEYTFSGNTGAATRVSGATIEYSGSVKKGALTLNLKVTMASVSGVVGTYTLGSVEWGDVTTWQMRGTSIAEHQTNSIAASALYLDAQVRVPEYSKDKYPTIKDYLLVAGPASNFVNLLPGAARSMGGAMLYQVLNSVTIAADGNIVAKYSSEETKLDMEWAASYLEAGAEEELISKRNWLESPKNLAYWFEKDGQFYVKLNIPAIVAQVMKGSDTTDLGDLSAGIDAFLNGKITVSMINALLKTVLGTELKAETINTLLGWVKNGFPVNVTTTNEHTYFYLDKETLSPIIAELPALIPVITGLIPEGQGAMLANMLKSIPIGWEYTDVFNIGLDLKKN